MNEKMRKIIVLLSRNLVIRNLKITNNNCNEKTHLIDHGHYHPLWLQPKTAAR